jgi:DNA-binding transcriptional regulator YdaS (Cro superfamily)
MDRWLAELFGVAPEKISQWVHAGRYVSGTELAEAGLAQLVPLAPLDILRRRGRR